MKIYSILVVLLCVVMPAFGAEDSAALANQLSQGLFQSTFCAISGGDGNGLGLLFGLALAAIGFGMLIFKGLSTTCIAFIVGGIIFTAMPSLFLSILDGTSSALVSVDAQQRSFSGLGGCGGE